MNILEKEIEDIVYESLRTNPQLLRERGMYVPEKMNRVFRQLSLGSYGTADIVAFSIDPEYGSIHVTIYELKKDVVDINTATQAARYGKAIRRICNKHLHRRYIGISYVLIGKKIAGGDFVYLLDEMDNFTAYTYSVDLEKGVWFQSQSGWYMREESLPSIPFSISEVKEMITETPCTNGENTNNKTVVL